MAYDKFKSESYELLGGMNSKVSEYSNGPMEFRDIVNLHFSSPGSLTKRPGSALYVGATVVGRITGAVEFQRLNGASYIVATANTNAYTVSGSFTPFKTGLLENALFDFTTFVDRLFCANGNDFFKFDGVNASAFSLPEGILGFNAGPAVGGSMTAGITGVFIVSYGYLNDRGYYGPVAPGITVTLNGVTFNSIAYSGFTIPSGYGISAISLYRTTIGGADLTGTTLVPGSLVTPGTTFIDTGFPLTTRVETDAIHFTLAPKYLEIYNNQLFMAGFSSLLSTAYWSQVGEPEGVEPEFFAEFRTNDGDRITGLKAYDGSLIVTKERSFHRVKGDDPNSFLLVEVSDQYGCLSHRAMVVFENLLWFLDSKGIVQYDGAQPKIVSNKMQDVFDRMNIDAAKENACAIHNRRENEVWFAIPCNGATFNNCIVVYDYLTGAWTKYEGVEIAAMLEAKGSLSIRSILFGGYTGSLSYFGASLFGDNGQAITCMIDSPFISFGQSTEWMWRRFYLNVNPILGFTQPIEVSFKTNYGTTSQLTRTMYQAPFQSSLDFGLPARSIQARVIHSSASLPLQIYGYTFERRFQRAD